MVHNELCTATRNVVRIYNQLGRADQAGSTAQSAIGSLGCPAEMFR